MIRRMLSVILCMALMLTVLVALPQEAEAAQSITLSEIETKMDAYISWLNASSKKYWNANVKEAALKAALDKGDRDAMHALLAEGNARKIESEKLQFAPKGKSKC